MDILESCFDPIGAANPSGVRPAAAASSGTAADEESAWVFGSVKEVAEIGLRLMRRLEAEVERTVETGAPPGPLGGKDPVAAYDRLARSLRLTLALRDKLIGSAKRRARERTETREEAFGRALDAERPRAKRRRERIAAAVAKELRERKLDPDDAVEILTELTIRLVERERDGEGERHPDLGRMTIAEAVALICKDFRIPFDPTQWIGATMTLDEAGARPPGPPAAGTRPAEPGPPANAAGHDSPPVPP